MAIRFRQSCTTYIVLWECRSCFQKYCGHCVACLFDMVASYSSSLRWRVVYFFVQGLSVIAVARLLKVGLTFLEKIRKKYTITCTFDYPAGTGKASKINK